MKKTLLLLLAATALIAAPQQKMVKVIVAPDHPDWTYRVGETVEFTITVLRYGNPLKDVTVKYEIKPEQMEAVQSDSLVLKKGFKKVNSKGMKQPGFLRCWATAYVDGKEYRGYATAGFSPEKIKPTIDYPDDFTEFWEKAISENAKIPLDTRMTLIPDQCSEKSDVYHVSLQNFKNGSRFYGILSKPKAEGKYPAYLKVPGAGARPYNNSTWLSDDGIIVFEVGIHGVPVNMERSVYNNMMRSAIDGYWFYNLDDRDKYYYKRVYLGCVRSVDFIFSLPEFDGETLAVGGGSQGGALSIVTAGLDKRVKWLAPYYPAMCDQTGYLHGRAGGWPHTYKKEWHGEWHNTPAKLKTLGYYDVVNFARNVTQPGIYSWGYNDTVCPPTSMHAAYNVIEAKKTLILAQDTGHWTYPEQKDKTNAWIKEKLLKK